MSNKFINLNLKFNEEIDKDKIKEDILIVMDENKNILKNTIQVDGNVLNIKVYINETNISKVYELEFKKDLYSKNNSILKSSKKIKFFLDDSKVLNNGNRVVKQGNWIYYTSSEKLYTYVNNIPYGEIRKINLDKTLDIKLCYDFGSRLWIDNEWIYYINYKGIEHDNYLYRIRKDGEFRQRLSDESIGDIAISDDCVFYSQCLHEKDLGNYQIYKIDKDGKNKIKLKGVNGFNLQICGAYLYYIHSINKSVYRIRIDGQELSRLNNDDSSTFMKVHNSWIYFISEEDNYKLYRMRIDGEFKQKLTQKSTTNVFIQDDKIYFVMNNDCHNTALFKMNLDGEEIEEILQGDCSREIFPSGEYIYYSGNMKKGLFKVKNDGSENIKLLDDDVLGIDVVEPWIFYYNLDCNDLSKMLFRIKIDGTQKEIVY